MNRRRWICSKVPVGPPGRVGRQVHAKCLELLKRQFVLNVTRDFDSPYEPRRGDTITVRLFKQTGHSGLIC